MANKHRHRRIEQQMSAHSRKVRNMRLDESMKYRHKYGIQDGPQLKANHYKDKIDYATTPE